MRRASNVRYFKVDNVLLTCPKMLFITFHLVVTLGVTGLYIIFLLF
jgi:hypothetical protein